MTDYTPSFDASEGAGGGAAAYLTSLVTELKPLVDRELRTKTGREDTAMIGSSLGGLVTAWASVHHASTFGLCGAMSPSTWWDNTMILSEVSTLAAQSTKPLRIYVDSGDSGPSLDDNANTALLAGRYRTSGYVDGRDLLYVLARGARHNESYWAERLPGALRFLVGPRPHTGAMP
jgi:predicted alpha/beta superfamily hydrolase